MIGEVGMDSSNRIDVGFYSIRIDSSTRIDEWMGDSLVGMGEYRMYS